MNNWKKNKYIITSIVIFFAFLTAMLISYNKIWKDKVQSPWAVMKVEDSPNYLGSKDIIELQNGKDVSQKIQMVSENLTGVAIKFANVDKKATGIIEIELLDSNSKLVERWKLDCAILQTDGYCNVQLKKDIKVKVGEKYELIIRPRLQDGKGLALELSRPSVITGHANVKGEKNISLSLAYKLYDGDGSALKYLIVAIIITALVAMLGSFLMMKKGKIASTFVVMTFFIGCIYIFVLPPFAVPDESAHFVTVYSKSNKLLGKEVTDKEGKVIADSNMGLYFIREEYPTKESYIRFVKGALGKNSDTITTKEGLANPLNVKAIGYIPQIIGVSIARILGGSGEQILLIGRLFALLWYCFVMYFAIRIFPFNKMIIFAVGLLPMTIQQVCSFSYDSILLGLCFFLISYILWLIYTKESVEIKDVLILVCAISGIVMIKYIYIPIIGLLLLVPKQKFNFRVNRKKIALYMFGMLSIVEIVSKMTLITEAAEKNMQIRSDGLYKYSIGYIMSNLGDTLVVVVRTIFEKLSFFVESMIANPLGWVDIQVPNIIVMGFAIVLIFSAIPNHISKKTTKKLMIMSGVIVILVSGLVLAAMLISYTYVGSDIILGVQGRYFLPVLPLILLIIQGSKNIVVKDSIETELILAIMGLQLYTIWSIVSIVITR